MYLYLFVSIHILCLLILAGVVALGRLDLSIAQLVIAALVPVFGPLGLVSIIVNENNQSLRDRVVDVNQMKIEDEIYRSIHLKPDSAAAGILPLEESLLFNSPIKRRQLLLNVLSYDASDYVPSLRLAGINDDTEVVHYAVTALVELRNDYNDRIHDMEQKMEDDDPEVLRDFIDLEEAYISSELPENGELKDSINRYDSLLLMTAVDGLTAKEKIALIKKRAGNAIALRDYKRALSLIEELIKMEPEKEEGYLLKIHCLSALKDRKGIDRVLQMIDDNNVFLTETGRQTLDFWQADGVES